MSEKPNSQEQRRSSNIEVRIPQVPSTNDETETPVVEAETTASVDPNNVKVPDGVKMEASSEDKQELILAKPETVENTETDKDEIKISKELVSDQTPDRSPDTFETVSKAEEKLKTNSGDANLQDNTSRSTDVQSVVGDKNDEQNVEVTLDKPATTETNDEQKVGYTTDQSLTNGKNIVGQLVTDAQQHATDAKQMTTTKSKDSDIVDQPEANNADGEDTVDQSKTADDEIKRKNEEEQKQNKNPTKTPQIKGVTDRDHDEKVRISLQESSNEDMNKTEGGNGDKTKNLDKELVQSNKNITVGKTENMKQISTESNEKKNMDLPKTEVETKTGKQNQDTNQQDSYSADENNKQDENVAETDTSKSDLVQGIITKETTKTNKPKLNHENSQEQETDKTPAKEKKETSKPLTPRSPKLRNLEAMQEALSTRKKSESGFVLSSQFEELEEESLLSRDLPEGGENEIEPKHRLATTSVHFQTGPSTKDKETAYMTETSDRVFTPDGRESRGSRTYSPAYFDTGARRSPEGEAKERKPRKEKKDPKKVKLLERLNLSKQPEKFILKLRPLKQDPDPTNKAPLNPNIYYAEVPKEGGKVKTPFYMQVDIPDGALDGDVRLKFEKQEFDRMKLGLSESDTLCSYIVDLNMEPHSCCLRQNATVKMRILDKCMNKYEDTVVIAAQHFSWTRIPSSIESKNVNGEKHYYAVTKSQSFGKFAVINAKKIDRFLISTAGGLFKSTIIPEIRFHVDENHLSQLPTQMIEMIVKETKQEAVERINKDISAVKGVEGRLVAASSEIEISKNLMTQTGKMKHGIRFPDKLTLVLPLPPLLPTKNTQGDPQTRSVVVMQKHTNPKYHSINGHRYHPTAYSKNSSHHWKNVTGANKLAVEGVSFRQEEVIPIKVSAPGKYMVLVFENDNISQQQDDVEPDYNLDDVTNAVVETNQEYEANIMIHQKVSQPSIIFIHMVTSDAIQPIHDTMRATNSWRQLYVSRQLLMHEWQPIKLEFKGDLQLTINQMTPQIRFFSKRWQGYQIQLEATEEAFATDLETFTGNISFVEQPSESIQISEEYETLCSVDVEIERAHAKPYKPTVVKKIIPKATIYREYKMKWLKDLSEEEIERYRATHGV